MTASLVEVGQTLSTWPQLASSTSNPIEPQEEQEQPGALKVRIHKVIGNIYENPELLNQQSAA